MSVLRKANVTHLFSQKPSDVKWENYWNPKLYIDNTVGEARETIWRTIVFNSNEEAFVYERRRVKGVFMQNMELSNFPFDTQVTDRAPTNRCFQRLFIPIGSKSWKNKKIEKSKSSSALSFDMIRDIE